MRSREGGRALKAIWDNQRFSCAHKAILQAFAIDLDFRGDFLEERYCSLGMFVRRSGLSQSTTQRVLRELIAHGYMRKRRGRGRGHASVFALTEKLFHEYDNRGTYDPQEGDDMRDEDKTGHGDHIPDNKTGHGDTFSNHKTGQADHYSGDKTGHGDHQAPYETPKEAPAPSLQEELDNNYNQRELRGVSHMTHNDPQNGAFAPPAPSDGEKESLLPGETEAPSQPVPRRRVFDAQKLLAELRGSGRIVSMSQEVAKDRARVRSATEVARERWKWS